eukprot:gene7936-8791_t
MYRCQAQFSTSTNATTNKQQAQRPRSISNSLSSRQISVKNGRHAVKKSNCIISSSTMGNFFSWALSIIYKNPSRALKESELQILQKFTNTSCQSQFIPISNDVEVRTLRFDLGFPKNTPALVLLHGLVSGLGIWSPCFDLLAQHCLVYAVDLPGFGRSTRTQFFGDRSDIEYQFISYMEEWRDAVGLESFYLVGHGFSGYLATLYAIKYPERVKHLVLVEPWGFTELPFGIAGRAAKMHGEQDDITYEDNIPGYIKILNYALNFLNPVGIIRNMPARIAMWIYSKFIAYVAPVFHLSSKMEKTVAMNTTNFKMDVYGRYLYCCNLLKPTGQKAYGKLNLLYFWAKSPLMYQIRQLDENTPMSFIYGSMSSMDHKTGYEAYHQRQTSTVEVYMIHNAGHNLLMDSPERLSDIIINIIDSESQKDDRVRLDTTDCSETTGTEDLYWDCAWETINLSHANLNFVEGGIQDSLFEEWDDFEFEGEQNKEEDDEGRSEEDVFYGFDA